VEHVPTRDISVRAIGEDDRGLIADCLRVTSCVIRATPRHLFRWQLDLPLRYLDLNGTPVTNAGLVHLKGLTNLKQLDLRNTKATRTDGAKLKKFLPKCNIIRGGLRR